MRRKQSNEHGAVAVIVAITCVMLFATAALAVDMGNAFTRKRDVQAQADFAAIAAGKLLNGETSGEVPVAVVEVVREYLNSNQPQDDDGGECLKTSTCVSSADLTDGDPKDGEVEFVDKQLRITAPQAMVRFGLAAAIGFNNTSVSAQATVGLFSPGGGTMPFYATSACGYGIQTLKSNSGGLSIPVTVPPLSNNGDSNAAVLTGSSPLEVPLNEAAATITLSGSSLADVTDVGFFRSNMEQPIVSGATVNADGTVSAAIPSTVTAVQDVWYVRVRIASAWSSRAQAQALQVGGAVLQCDPDQTTGNFGTLSFPGYSGGNDAQTAKNIAAGLKSPLTLAKYPDPVPTGLCPSVEEDPDTVLSTSATDLKPGTNCGLTQPGLRAEGATAGFITGVEGPNKPGRLDADTSEACLEEGRPERGPTLGLNDDLLTCFFIDPMTYISAAISPTYTGPPLFSSDIYASPRFIWVPVLGFDPAGSKVLPIVGFRPGFITDQPTGASRNNDLVGTETNNGLVVTTNGNSSNSLSLRAIRVIFFNSNALPSPDGGPVRPYFGSGPKVVRLVN